MPEELYDIIINHHTVAKEVSLDYALIFVKAIFETFYMEDNVSVSIQKSETKSTQNTAQKEQDKTSVWIDTADNVDASYFRHSYYCQHCGEEADYFIGGSENWWSMEAPKYCPSCGRKMIGEIPNTKD